MPRCIWRCSASPSCCGRVDLRGAGRNVPGPPHGRPDPGACAPAPSGSAAAISAQRISIKTGDELEGLANQFNDMGARLQESYADLENKVEQRTAELSESLQQQTATAEVLKVISRSAVDLKPVFQTMLTESATRMCGAQFGMMFLCDGDDSFRSVALFDCTACVCRLQAREPDPSTQPQDGLGTDRKDSSGRSESRTRRNSPMFEGDPADSWQCLSLRRARDRCSSCRCCKENELIGAIAISLARQVRPVHRQADRAGQRTSPTRR